MHVVTDCAGVQLNFTEASPAAKKQRSRPSSGSKRTGRCWDLNNDFNIEYTFDDLLTCFESTMFRTDTGT